MSFKREISRTSIKDTDDVMKAPKTRIIKIPKRGGILALIRIFFALFGGR